jgi:hypothetical protein
VSGVQYQSRHGDEFTSWALYERETKHASPPQISDHASHEHITPEDPDLLEAMRIHEIEWEDE